MLEKSFPWVEPAGKKCIGAQAHMHFIATDVHKREKTLIAVN